MASTNDKAPITPYERFNVGQNPQAWNMQGVVQQAHIQAIVVETPVRWSWCPLIITLFATLCCCPLCGIPGLAAAVLSYTDHKAKEYGRAANKRSVALGCGITGLVLGVIAIIILIALPIALEATVYNLLNGGL